MKSLRDLQFDNSFARLPPALHARVDPEPFAAPHLVAVSEPCMALLGLDGVPERELVDVFSGRMLLPGMMPIAQKYTGHQFGQYNPELGDGRGLLLGEVVTASGERWDLHLKGAGRTPFSRMGDGRAVLRSTIREFLASEALAHLGVPTTRALCIIGSNETVYRETAETGAMLLRVARSHIRFGHFEYLYHSGQHALLQEFLHYVVALHFPQLEREAHVASAFFREVVVRTAHMAAHWHAIGFAHGVMNTDNFSILGDTFDFGPYAFLDAFQPGLVCNHSDWEGRYAFNRQPGIALWNLNCLGLALSGLLSREQLVEALELYDPAFHGHYRALMRNRLGLDGDHDEDESLIGDLLVLMARQGADYTRTLRRLVELDMTTARSAARDEFVDRDAFDAWCRRYVARLRANGISEAQRHALMLRSNPKYVLRNWMAQVAIERAQAGDFSEVTRLLRVLERPFDEQPEHEDLAALPPSWSSQLEISCSS